MLLQKIKNTLEYKIMEDSLSRASFRGKETFKLPAGAKVISKEVTVDVEEIENGFLVCKRTEFKYRMKERDYNDYGSITKKFFSKENPLTLDESLMEDSKESVADKF